MMGKTTCPQRERTFLRCLPICFGGAAHFGLNSEWQAGSFSFFFFPPPFLQLEQVSVGDTGGVIKQIQLGQVPLSQRWWLRLSLPHRLC